MGEKFGQCQNFLFFTGKQGRLFSSCCFFCSRKVVHDRGCFSDIETFSVWVETLSIENS